jgi:hypothetical protein
MHQSGVAPDPKPSLSIREHWVRHVRGHSFRCTETASCQIGDMTKGRPLNGMPHRPDRSVHIFDYAAWSPRQSEMSNHAFSLYAGDSMRIANPKSSGLGRQE